MDEQEFDEFYAASFRRVTTQVYALIGDAEEAADCVQEAFARAWSHRRKLDRAEYPEAWVRTTAHRLAISRWRRRRRDRGAPDRAVGGALATREVDETHVALVAALRQLPPAQREALVLHHIADLPVHRVAVEVGAPEGTVKARLSRGRTALAALLTDDPSGGIAGGINHA
ncbi:sigma-70 family RNA polymerase sigma factor [Nocardioides panacisoli]|uniref:RNA polymerase sigma factor n=1 Tax=Nocardioides panacisoli TaxID=627624 RepID=UPI001C62B3DE|nr:sigma-70 family RNA polymerase sigma factor [Nocardioides panacisoli]QYJ02534.1 sigma-70 family RNA polymerase sigma factor [Nocardioides panacisoli]